MLHIKKRKKKEREIHFWHSMPMHLHVLPEANMSGKTVVSNLSDYLVLKFGFPKRICGVLEGAEFISNFIRKFLKSISYNCQLPTDQKGEQPTQPAILRVLLIFA